MRVRTLVLYLVGSRQAIFDIASDRHGLWVGLLLVLSAGLARDYDGADLLHEPWHLLIPVGASLAASFLLFLAAWGRFLYLAQDRPMFFASYRAFLSLFWMTAPLAWLYAIPYERFLSAGDATAANLWTLALVAAWRVALMTRVISVLTGRGLASSFCLVMAVADAVALAAVYLMPRPLLTLMAGIGLTESDAFLQGTAMLVSCLGILSAPLWGLLGLLAYFSGHKAWQVPVGTSEMGSPSRGMWTLTALSLAIWLPILPWTQAEQRLRYRVERDMKAGRIAEALDLMSEHSPSDFPPHWDPPPREGYGETSPHLLEVMEVLLAHEVAPWVQTSYMAKFRRYFDTYFFNSVITGNNLAPLVRILKRLPDVPNRVVEYRKTSEDLYLTGEISEDHRQNLNELLKLADKVDPSKR